MQGNTQSAYDLFYYGYNNNDARKPDSRTFFDKLRLKIVEEYESQGRCELIDYLLKQGCYIDPVAYAAICDAGEGLSGGKMFDIYQDNFVPKMMVNDGRGPRRADWNECVRPNQFAPYLSTHPAAEQLFKKVRACGEKAYKAAQRERGRDSKRQAEQRAQLILSDAQRRAQEKLDSAQAEAARILEDARREGREIVARAKAEAEAEAKTIKINAQTAAEMREEAQAKQTSEKLIKRYLAQDLEAFRQDYEADLAAIRRENREVSGEIEREHDRMVEQTNAIQRAITAAVSSAIEDMSNMREDLYKKLQGWQASLYPHEYEPLAQRYVELYRIINVERLLAEEVLFQHSQQTEAAPATIAGLERLNRTLTTFLQKFESSLSGVGLYVFRPEEGDAFDEVQHMTESEDMVWDSRTIVRCVVPGVAKKTVDAEEDDVIIRATVEI